MQKSTPANIKVILFDLDDTLCDTEASKYTVFSRIYQENPKFQSVSEVEFIDIAVQQREKYLQDVKGLQTYARIKFWSNVLRELKVTMPVRELKNVIDQYWSYTLAELKLFPNVEEALLKLYESPILTAIFAGADFYSKSTKLIKLGIDKYFNYIFTSDLAQIPKTDKRIYEWVGKFFHHSCEEILMVGNSIAQDITPANEANMKTAQVKFKEKSIPPSKWPKRPNYVIYNINGVLEIAGIKAS